MDRFLDTLRHNPEHYGNIVLIITNTNQDTNYKQTKQKSRLSFQLKLLSEISHVINVIELVRIFDMITRSETYFLFFDAIMQYKTPSKYLDTNIEKETRSSLQHI